MTLYAADFDTFTEDLCDPTDDPSVVQFDEADEPCMGEGCLNPHPDHSLAECYTLEMCEANEPDADPAPIAPAYGGD